MKTIILSLMTVALATVSYNAVAQDILDATLSDRMPAVATSKAIDAGANLESNDLSLPTMNKPNAVSVVDTQNVSDIVEDARADISSEVDVIGANTASDLMGEKPVMEEAPMEQKTMDMTSDMKHNDHPLCNAAHTQRADVTADGGTRVMAPKMIPLSVELANQLNIRGFENIEADGPIGFLTVNDQGKVFFEGQDLSGNVGTLCASGEAIAPVNASAMAPVMDEKAPDGNAYNAMPGQGGFKMQPIIDGPSYKTPPKRKKPAPKKVEAKVETEAKAVVREDVAPVMEEDTSVDTNMDVKAEVEAIDEDVSLPSKVMVDEAVDASESPDLESNTGSSLMFEGAVEEVLGTSETN